MVVSSAPRGAVAGATVPERTVHHSLAPGVRSDAFATALGACVCAAAWLTPANAAEEGTQNRITFPFFFPSPPPPPFFP